MIAGLAALIFGVLWFLAEGGYEPLTFIIPAAALFITTWVVREKESQEQAQQVFNHFQAKETTLWERIFQDIGFASAANWVRKNSKEDTSSHSKHFADLSNQLTSSVPNYVDLSPREHLSPLDLNIDAIPDLDWGNDDPDHDTILDNLT